MMQYEKRQQRWLTGSIRSGRQNNQGPWPHLSRLVMMLMIGALLSSCGSLTKQIEVKTVQIPPIVMIPSEPTAPNLADQLPPSLRLTAADARYYQDVCDMYQGEENAVEISTGLSREAACNWVIDGYTVQGGLTVEYLWIQTADYIDRLRSWGRSLQDTIKAMQQEGE